MSVSGFNSNITTVAFADQTADATFALLRAPAAGATLLGAYVVPSATFDADGSNHYTVSVLDGGADGTGTTSMGSVGGASVDFTANTAAALTLTSTKVDAGDYIMVKYDEEGTVAPGNLVVIAEWVHGGN